ncbi:MAG: radical SAM protein [Candidatus Cloacimonetes bacterium]|nr:radical SAM protein [Candidatus Cloacimonadota bacterium]
MPKIAIAQIDGSMPNFALMKIAGYHESKGDTVCRYEGELFESEYDTIYASKIFDFSPMPQFPKRTIFGGTGIDHSNKLPPEIEKATPSYTLYSDCDYHLGFTQKGCRNACGFCVVPKKEGKPYPYNTIDEILVNPKGTNKLLLLDNDFFGGEFWNENLQRIIDLKLKVCFQQGINIRNITPEQAQLLAKCNYYNVKFKQRYISFAWDNIKDKELIKQGIKICNDAGIPSKNMQFFILIGYNSTQAEDFERVEYLREIGAMPFVMKYKKDDPYQKHYARYVNLRSIFNSIMFDEYEPYKRYKKVGLLF